MANGKGRRRRFGAIRRLPSGRYQARCPGPDGVMRPAPETIATTADADERLRTTGAKTTTAKAYRLLKGIMETVVDDDLIKRIPCRIKGTGKEKAAEPRIATVAQVDALADQLGPRRRLMVYLGAYGPLRPEELAGLRRRDINVDHLKITVRLAEPERTNGRRAPGDTKSEAGTRTVYLPEFLRPELRIHMELFAGKGPDGLVYDLRHTGHTQSQKTFHHPQVGTLTLSGQSMQLEETPGQRLGVYTAEPGTPDHDAMLLLDMTAPQPAGQPDTQVEQERRTQS
ncbi:hypothetical protein [Streptomyces sp. NPDC001401]|uniref:MmyB family transcriptional regulator n=1 Tax=Streptomyces sp. NPDC001401 TaxID=3364570 RepID=UPI00368CC089